MWYDRQNRTEQKCKKRSVAFLERHWKRGGDKAALAGACLLLCSLLCGSNGAMRNGVEWNQQRPIGRGGVCVEGEGRMQNVKN